MQLIPSYTLGRFVFGQLAQQSWGAPTPKLISVKQLAQRSWGTPIPQLISVKRLVQLLDHLYSQRVKSFYEFKQDKMNGILNKETTAIYPDAQTPKKTNRPAAMPSKSDRLFIGLSSYSRRPIRPSVSQKASTADILNQSRVA
jgi:hypothetical protein